jgi:hypothetical protein
MLRILAVLIVAAALFMAALSVSTGVASADEGCFCGGIAVLGTCVSTILQTIAIRCLVVQIAVGSVFGLSSLPSRFFQIAVFRGLDWLTLRVWRSRSTRSLELLTTQV